MLSKRFRKARLGDLFICRVNAPLIRICLRLIKNGIKSKVRGKDISVNLVALASRVVGKSKNFWPLQFMGLLRFYVSKQVEILKADGVDDAVEKLQDFKLCLEYFYEEIAVECATFDEFCNRIKGYFIGDKEGNDDSEEDDLKSVSRRSSRSKSLAKVGSGDRSDYLILSTVHRAKGDEAKRVFVVGSNLLPFYHPSQTSWQRQQELNILYVALTRAKEELYLVPINRYKIDDVKSVSKCLKHPLGGIILP